jgi:hypothetical protein
MRSPRAIACITADTSGTPAATRICGEVTAGVISDTCGAALDSPVLTDAQMGASAVPSCSAELAGTSAEAVAGA